MTIVRAVLASNANSVHQEKSVSAGVMSPDFLLFHAVDIGPGSYQQCRL
jgi:hypothetical protein